MTAISNGELMTVLLEIKGEVGQIKGIVDGALQQMQTDRIRVASTEIVYNEKFGKSDERLRKVENGQYWVGGFGGALGAILGALGVHIKL